MPRTHIPVLAGELIDALDPAPGAVAVDCTFGAGGHARLVADRIGPTGELVCIDRDPDAEEHFASLAAAAPCATRFIHGDYADVLPELIAEGLAADLVYLDLGISSMQVDARERGFSYSYDAPLDMRMDPSAGIDARTVVNGWPEARLAQAVEPLSRWHVLPSGTLGWNKAEVTLGGVDTRGLSSQTMMAASVRGLHFIGEVVDVTGWLGGYNFQWAWASGNAAGLVV